MRTKSYEGHLGHSVKRLHHVMGLYFNDVLRSHGVAQSQWYLLYAISSRPPATTQRELLGALQIESATLTAAVDALVRKGWVERAPSTADRRVKEVRLTPSGLDLWGRLPDPITATRRAMLRGIAAGDRDAAQRVLDHATVNLEAARTRLERRR
jgi:MarR family transcriptional regulator for hemolysin